MLLWDGRGRRWLGRNGKRAAAARHAASRASLFQVVEGLDLGRGLLGRDLDQDPRWIVGAVGHLAEIHLALHLVALELGAEGVAHRLPGLAVDPERGGIARVQEAAARKGQDAEAYVIDAVERALRKRSLDEMLAPVRSQFAASGMTEEELTALVKAERRDVA